MRLPHPTYPRYLVGDDGSIVGPSGKLLRPFLDAHGYQRINIWVDGTWRQFSVHSLVCETFHGARPSARHGVGHWDGDKTNNSADNLRWVTQLENEADKKRHGRDLSGERHHKAVLTEADVLEIRASSLPLKLMSLRYGVAVSTISAAKTGATWRHVAGAASAPAT